MAISLADLKQTSRMAQPARLLVYGQPKIGKTSLAAEFPDPVILDVERGVPAGIDIPGWDNLDSYDAVLEAIGELYGAKHGFKTLILDSLDKFEPMVWAKTCAHNKWTSIESPGYGKGYVEADRFWRELLDGLNACRRDRGMTIVLIAHSHIVQVPSPTSDPYPAYDIRLHKRALAMVQDEVDAILFVNHDATVKTTDTGFNKKHAHAEGGGTRWIHTEMRPAWTAGNRYGMPDKILYRKGQGFAELAKYLPASPVSPASSESTETAKQAA